MTTETQTFDQARAEAFAGKMFGALNETAVVLFSSVAHQTGLYDKLSTLPPLTSEEIAKAAELNERYVREILGGLTVGGVVTYDPATKRYALPAEHAAFLTRAAGPNNLAYFAQYIPLMGNIEPELIEAFRNGGGVPYAKFPRFQVLQRGETAAIYDAALTGGILPLVPGLTEKLDRGIDVLDVGCGGGHAINLLAKAFPKSRFTGYDFSEDGLELGRSEAKEWGLTNANFVLQDVAKMTDDSKFDLITALDTIHDQAQPRTVLACIKRALRPDGTFLMGDIAASSNLEENYEHPLGPALYMFSVFHCMTVSLALGGEGLGTVWGEQKARELLAEAGFKTVDTAQVEGDFMNIYYTCRK